MALARQRRPGRVAGDPAKWRGIRRVNAEPLIHDRYQPACKPGSVGHRPLARTIRDGHSSETTFARCLERPTRTASLTSLPRRYRFRELPAWPSLFGLAPGVVYHAGSVAGPAVRSYRTFSPLLAAAACAAMAQQARKPVAPKPRRGEGGRFVLCGTVPGVAPAGCYPAPYVDGARTFLPRDLSAVAGAAVRPTDAPTHGGSSPPGQADNDRARGQNNLS